MKKADQKHLAGVFAVSPASWAPALHDPYSLPPVCVRGACPGVRVLEHVSGTASRSQLVGASSPCSVVQNSTFIPAAHVTGVDPSAGLNTACSFLSEVCFALLFEF